MSTVGSAVAPSKFVTLDRMLLGFTSVFLLSHAVAYYVSMHTDSVLETIFTNLVLIFVGPIVAIVVTVRIGVLIFISVLRQRWLISSALLTCAALLTSYLFMGRAAVSYALDQFRFHMNEDFYVTEVVRSNSSPKFVIVDWGGSEFLGWRTRYFLVFDENNSIARGLADPMDMPLPNENTRCDTSIYPLRGSFYSVTVYCEPA
jgi:hypothetical protein